MSDEIPMDNRHEATNERVRELEHGLDELRKVVRGNKEENRNGIEGLYSRLAQRDEVIYGNQSRINELEERVDGTRAWVVALNGELGKLEAKVDSESSVLTDRMSRHWTIQTELQQKVDGHGGEINGLRQRVATAERQAGARIGSVESYVGEHRCEIDRINSQLESTKVETEWPDLAKIAAELRAKVFADEAYIITGNMGMSESLLRDQIFGQPCDEEMGRTGMSKVNWREVASRRMREIRDLKRQRDILTKTEAKRHDEVKSLKAVITIQDREIAKRGALIIDTLEQLYNIRDAVEAGVNDPVLDDIRKLIGKLSGL